MKLPSINWKRAGKYLFALSLTPLIAAALFYYYYQWKWDELRAEMEAAGTKLFFTDMVPDHVPDEENFYADPIWLELSDIITLEDGSQRTRFPKEELLINVLNPPLTKEEHAELSLKFPHLKLSSKSRNAMVRELGVRAKQLPVEQRREAAEHALTILKPATPLLDKLSELGQRPKARFPYRYRDGFSIRQENITYLIGAGQLLGARSLAYQQLGKADEALADIFLIIMLAQTEEDTPIPISQLIRLTLVKIALTATDSGVKEHLWTQAQLKAISQKLGEINVRQSLRLSIQGDRGMHNTLVYDLLNRIQASTGFPKPAQIYFRVIIPYNLWKFNSTLNDQVAEIAEYRESGLSPQKTVGIKSPQKMQNFPGKYLAPFAELSAHVNGLDNKTFVDVETSIALTRTAIALELYQDQHQRLPESLTHLVPEFLDEVPKDLYTNQPMRYQPRPDGTFLLYSVGRDRIDQGGHANFSDDGDLVWGESVTKKKP